MNRDEIMLWLNDRLGREVNVSLYLERDGLQEILAASGTLKHWSEENAEVVEWRAGLGRGLDELAARYSINPDTTLDLTNYDDVCGDVYPTLPDQRLDITLADDLILALQFPARPDPKAAAEWTRRVERG